MHLIDTLWWRSTEAARDWSEDTKCQCQQHCLKGPNPTSRAIYTFSMYIGPCSSLEEGPFQDGCVWACSWWVTGKIGLKRLTIMGNVTFFIGKWTFKKWWGILKDFFLSLKKNLIKWSQEFANTHHCTLIYIIYILPRGSIFLQDTQSPYRAS